MVAFSIALLWMINGIVFYAVLFTTGQWLRLVPTTWEVIPDAASTALRSGLSISLRSGGARRVSSPNRTAHRTGHLAVLLAQRDDAGVAEFDELVKDGFAHYRLRIDGLVEKPVELTYAELKAMPKQEQITTHFCIQGWSGVARWGGVPMRHLLGLVKPTADARYAVFYSLADGGDGGRYYDVHRIANMRHELTMLAYEMNGAPLSVLHGAPLRLRCENELGFKMVKWIAAIEFVHDFADLGAGEGGYNEDHEF
ncbi:molybdopterin-binding oxidoreductase [Caballeronia terrestris]|uniref:Molybdopterin-binding oxidoreductase n=1 Tax=Caballeronia terrestris TaxID=1226301 RepID=A0A158KSA8_9BURK|nr:molybdopterin-dependent oxidoreductase [Caballeronia terrestris]SAL83480.1 molybdopterin-binding oxidoreductase [Caballeronia terrestris]